MLIYDDNYNDLCRNRLNYIGSHSKRTLQLIDLSFSSLIQFSIVQNDCKADLSNFLVLLCEV